MWIGGLLATLVALTVALKFYNEWQRAFGRKKPLDYDLSLLGGRLTLVEGGIKECATRAELIALEKSVAAQIDMKFSALDIKRSTDVRELHKHMESANLKIAGVQTTQQSQTATLENIITKLDRWIEGELAETRRELAGRKG